MHDAFPAADRGGGDDGGAGPDPDRHAEMRAVQLAAPDGSTGLPAFTGLDALLRWRPDARPVPCRLDELAAVSYTHLDVYKRHALNLL